MLLDVPPGTADWLRTTAEAALVVHVAAGGLGLAAGFAAISLPKGKRAHRLAGRVFVLSMTTMATLAAFIGTVMRERANVYDGALVGYLVVTAWASARRAEGAAGRFEIASLLAASALALAGAVGLSHSLFNPLTPLLARALMALYVGAAWVAAACDLRTLRRGLGPAQRVGRHLWRMCVALCIAAAFFVAQPRLFPTPIPALVALAAMPLAVMACWLIRLTRRGSKPPLADAPALEVAD